MKSFKTFLINSAVVLLATGTFILGMFMHACTIKHDKQPPIRTPPKPYATSIYVDTISHVVMAKHDLDDLTYNMIIARKFISTECSEENVIAFLNEGRFKFKAITYRVAKLESGFRSYLAMNNNNLFGMKLARSRITTANGQQMGFAAYSHWTMSVIDFYLYSQNLHSEDDVYDYMQGSYAEDSNHIQRLKSIPLPKGWGN